VSDVVAVLGPATIDEIVVDGGPVERRPGGTPHYAARALRAVGAAVIAIETGHLVSRLHHTAAGTEQEIVTVPEPLLPDRARALLPQLAGCRWVLLGGQTADDFPPETVRTLAGAGLLLCLDGQGLARGREPGHVSVRAIPQQRLEGIAALKVNEAEAEASPGLQVPELLVTRAERGAVVTAGGRRHVIEGGGHRLADPTGAGDTFGALYCLARTRGLAPDAAGRFAQDGVERLYPPMPG
jgi:sugar/nucleoside kinase (ribokinase family)